MVDVYSNHTQQVPAKDDSSLSTEDVNLKFVKCTLCDKVVYGRNRNQNLSKHMLTHSGDKPFHCELCDMTLIGKYQFRVHNERNHNEKIPCTICNAGFVSKCKLKLHMKDFKCSGGWVRVIFTYILN